jgi:uncharacterized protein (TIGR02996 family)
MDRTLSSLIRACKDEPFDNTRRLILADWLEENGDPDRAELIRLHMAMEDGWGDSPRLLAIELRCAELLRANSERWFGPAEKWYGYVEFERGFLSIHASTESLRRHPPMELPDHVLPWVEELFLSERMDDVPLDPVTLRCFSALRIIGNDKVPGAVTLGRLLPNPALEECRQLGLYKNQINADDVRALAGCERLAGLREINLNENPLGDEGAAALARAPWLNGLKRLRVGQTGIGGRGLVALLGSPHLGALAHLHLYECEVDDAAARALAESPKLAGLELLRLERCTFGQASLRALAHSPHLRPAEVRLGSVELGAEGVEALLSGPLLERTRELSLTPNKSTPEVAALLFSSPRLAALESLPVWGQVGDIGCEAIAAAEHFTNLRSCTLQGSGIGPKGAAALGRARSLKSLVALTLDNNPLGLDGVRGLVEGGGLPALETLYLNETLPEAHGLQALVGSGLASRLKFLSLEDNDLADEAAVALARMTTGQLLGLEMSGNRIGPKGMAALAGCSGLSLLAVLKLARNCIGDAGVRAIIASAHLGRLSILDLSTNDLTDSGGEALRAWPQRGRMIHLWAEDNNLSDDLEDEFRIS